VRGGSGVALGFSQCNRTELKLKQDEVDDEWLEEEELEILDRAKLLGMRICTHRALGFARHPEAATVVKDTFTLLQSILSEFENGKLLGQVNEKTMEG
jgi:sister-chromatid-cohesion protein PDS5